MAIPDYIPKGTKEEIEKELTKWVGKEVVRGPTWKWRTQDVNSEGKQSRGVVLFTKKWTDSVRVRWSNGDENYYRVGTRFADVILVNPEEVYSKVENKYLNLVDLKECLKNNIPVYFTKEAIEHNCSEKKYLNYPIELKKVKDREDNCSGFIVVFTYCNKSDFYAVDSKGKNNDIALFQYYPDNKNYEFKKKNTLGKAYEEAGVHPGDKVKIYINSYEGIVISEEEAKNINANLTGNSDKYVYCKIDKMITGSTNIVGKVAGFFYRDIKKINNIQQQQRVNEQQEVNEQQQENQTKDSIMKEQVISGLKVLGSEIKEGVKTGASAISSEEIVSLFHKHFDGKLPSWWNLIPNVKNVEATVLPGLVYLGTLFTDNKYAEKLRRPSLYAFRGKIYDLTKDAWRFGRPFIEDLYNLAVSKELITEEPKKE